jgi:hypothetical protein
MVLGSRLGRLGSPPVGRLGRPDGGVTEKEPPLFPFGLSVPENEPPDPLGPEREPLIDAPFDVDRDELVDPPNPFGPDSLELKEPPLVLREDSAEALPVPLGPFREVETAPEGAEVKLLDRLPPEPSGPDMLEEKEPPLVDRLEDCFTPREDELDPVRLDSPGRLANGDDDKAGATPVAPAAKPPTAKTAAPDTIFVIRRPFICKIPPNG